MTDVRPDASLARVSASFRRPHPAIAAVGVVLLATGAYSALQGLVAACGAEVVAALLATAGGVALFVLAFCTDFSTTQPR